MTISVRLSNEDSELIKAYADIKNISLSDLIRNAVLEKIEDEYDVAIADEAYQDYLKSGEKSRPVGALWKDLGI